MKYFPKFGSYFLFFNSWVAFEYVSWFKVLKDETQFVFPQNRKRL